MSKSTTKKTAEFVNPFEDFFKSGQDAMEKFVSAGTERYESVLAQFREQAGSFETVYGDAAEANKANIEAVIAAGAAYSKGLGEINAECMAFSKELIEGNLATSKAAFNAKTLAEAFELQGQQAKSNFDKVMSQNAKIGEMATKVAKESAEPINSRVAATMETFNKAAA